MLSRDRILTTHVGSLPRPDAICDLLRQQVEGQQPAAGVFDEAVTTGVDAVVARQKAAGIDIVSDGEISKLGYANYITDRLTGFEGDSERVLAGSDCGFSTCAGDGLVDPDICFAKFEAMAEGAKIASAKLWGR